MSTQPVLVESFFDHHQQVEIDPWATSPLVDDYGQLRPDWVEAQKQWLPAPTLFESGDLPPFTASGIDPQQLLRLPYTARHAAAAEPSPAAILGMIEEYAADPSVEFPHVGLDSYRERVTRWLHATPPPQQEFDADEDYAALFGEDA